MIKVFTSPYRSRTTGLWSKRRILLASFRFYDDAVRYIDHLRKVQEKWPIEEKWLIETQNLY